MECREEGRAPSGLAACAELVRGWHDELSGDVRRGSPAQSGFDAGRRAVLPDRARRDDAGVAAVPRPRGPQPGGGDRRMGPVVAPDLRTQDLGIAPVRWRDVRVRHE